MIERYRVVARRIRLELTELKKTRVAKLTGVEPKSSVGLEK